MFLTQEMIKRSLSLVCALLLIADPSAAQQGQGALRGQVTDKLGGVIVGASVTAIDSKGVEKAATTNEQGVFLIEGLAPGKYTVRVGAEGFAEFEKSDVNVLAGRRATLDIQLAATIAKEKMAVNSNGSSLSTEPGADKGGVVLRGEDLDALPDDPDDLANALRAMAGPSAGLNGAQIYLDGFSNGAVPSKDVIREIRINQNPFAAENDRIGYGRIEIFTRAGSDDYRASAFLIYNNRALNSRNPFVVNQPPFHLLYYSGSLSGPILAERATFLVNAARREINDNAIVNATILDPFLNFTSFSQAIVTPRRFTDVNPRVDYQFNKDNTLTGRYDFARSSLENAGVGDRALPSRAFDILSTEHRMQLTDTAVITPAVVNEIRFQYLRSRLSQSRVSAGKPTIRVEEAFVDGGPERGFALRNTVQWELQDHATWASGIHTFRFGGRLRGVSIDDVSRFNFTGTFIFLGGLAPSLDSNGQVVLGSDGLPTLSNITSLERYRRTLLFQRQGLDPSEVFALGGGPSFFTITGGDPQDGVKQIDFGGFFQGDSRVRPGLTLSYGLRYEAQNNIDSKLDFAPRIAFAWSPGVKSSRPTKTVIRGGAGIFYERFAESLTLRTNRFDGLHHLQFTISDPAILGLFPTVPKADSLAALAEPQTIVRIAEDLATPYTIQSGIGVERQLLPRLNATAAYIYSRGRRFLRSRNINAPLPGTFDPDDPAGGVRPFPDAGNIFQYESNGIFKQHQLVVNVTGRPVSFFTLFASYFLGKSQGDTDGAETFPRDSYDLSGEFGRSPLDIRHRAFVGGSANLPMSITVSPLVILSSGTPFNIVTGIDANGDSLGTERPGFAVDATRPGVRVTRYGIFDLNPAPGQAIIPRNFGESTGYFSASLRIGKTFDISRSEPAKPAAGRTSGGREYKLAVSVLIFNIFNRTNAGLPGGNLSSPFFGQATALGLPGGLSLAGANATSSNRRVDLNVRFTF